MPASASRLTIRSRRKSSYSSAKGQDCVTVEDYSDGSSVGDSQNPQLSPLEFTPAEWAALRVTASRGV
ncbi:DUF397 domain-containing protein [Nocardiopsis dassonvillei]|uniref:DUF397 domain-containing protein n=1 Tax=Nocardiopsis dassonvillei TaxID=2014 RepID=UPI0033C0FF88